MVEKVSSSVVEGLENDKMCRDDTMLLLTMLVNNTECLSVRSGNIHIPLVMC